LGERAFVGVFSTLRSGVVGRKNLARNLGKKGGEGPNPEGGAKEELFGRWKKTEGSLGVVREIKRDRMKGKKMARSREKGRFLQEWVRGGVLKPPNRGEKKRFGGGEDTGGYLKLTTKKKKREGLKKKDREEKKKKDDLLNQGGKKKGSRVERKKRNGVEKRKKKGASPPFKGTGMTTWTIE